MTTSQQSRLGVAPEEGIKAPVAAVASGNLALFDIGMTIAGYVVLDHDRICAAAQTDSTANGIYVARGGKTWERATDMNESDDVMDGQLMADANTSAVYNINLSAGSPWSPGVDTITFGLLLTPVGFFWGAITGTLSDQADLQAELDAKADVVHTHVEADITDLQAYLLDAAGSIAADGLFYGRSDGAWVSFPATYPPSAHVHVEADITDLGAYLLDSAGSIANDNQLWARANNTWIPFSTSSGTTGEIIAWPDDDLPQNFLWCDGVAHNAVTFADLFAVLGYKYGGSGANFNVPDLRGQFIRGTAMGSGNDPDRNSRTDRGDGTAGDVVGSKQTDQFKSHGHNVFTRVDPVGDSEGGNGDDRIQSFTTPTSLTGGSETRPINVGMNYIIRYTGGGSGITQPPSIEVQDNGVPLTTAVELFNFLGFTLTEDIDDQINVQYGSSQNAGQYCTGYTFFYVSDTVWRVTGLDVHQTFVNRRCRFIDGAANYYGTVLSSVFSGSDTIITMEMEDGEVLTNSITEICLTTAAAAWSAISEDPMAGQPINDIKTGVINGQQYWMIVGNNGKIFTSSNAGLNWSPVTDFLTTLNFYVAAYDSINEMFWAGGESGVLAWTDDMVTWNFDNTTIEAIKDGAGGTAARADIHGFVHVPGGDWLQVFYQENLVGFTSANSTDQGATWVRRALAGTDIAGNGNKATIPYWSASVPSGVIYKRVGNTAAYGVSNEADTAWGSFGSVGGEQNCQFGFYDPNDGTGTRVYGLTNQTIDGGANWSGNDSTTMAQVMNDMAYLDIHDRIVGVGDLGQIGYWNRSDKLATNAWTSIPNGFDPLTNILAIAANEVDGIYVAVAQNGQICRSTNGLGDPLTPIIFAGWTPIAADPFSGGNIQHIATGVIAGQEWWVIASSTLIFTSTNAGITWTSRTSGVSGSITDLKYDSTNEAFVAVCADGDFSRTTDGSTWVADTTTVQALPGLLGSGSINSLVWSPSSGEWFVVVEFNVSSAATFSVNAAMTVWTIRDVTTTSGTNAPNGTIYDANIGGRTIYTGISISYMWYADVTDTTPTSVNNMDANVTAALGKAGTLGDIQDMFIGNTVGKIELMSSTTVRAINIDALAGPVNAFAYSSMVDRMIAVGNAGEIKTQAGADIETLGTWLDVITPFGGNINDLDYNATDNMFICVCADGVIARSVDGISPMPVASGFTLVTSPFGGTPIRALQTGVVTGIQYWVAVGDDGKIAVSDDGGATWALITSNVTQNLTCIGYSSTLEQFCAGGDAGEYTYSTTLVSPLTGTWTAGDITDDFAHSGGSGRFQDISFDPDGINAWHCIWQRSSTSQAAAFSVGDPVTWSATDGGFFGIVTSKTSYVGTYILRIMYGEDEDVVGYTSAVDTGSSQLFNRTLVTVVTGFESKVGTFAAAIDVILGTTAGELFVYADSNTIRSQHNAMAGQVFQITWASALSRLIAVGANGEIWAMEQADLETNDAWYEITNPFTADITDIKYNSVDGYFVAVAADGTIGRSTDGIS